MSGEPGEAPAGAAASAPASCRQFARSLTPSCLPAVVPAGSLADQLQGLNLRDASKDRGTNGRGYYPNGRAAAPAPGGFYFPGPQQQQQQQIPGGRGPQAQRVRYERSL